MWSDKVGKEQDIVILTKVAVSRNIKGYPFTSKMSATEKENVLTTVGNATKDMNLKYLRIDQLNKEALDDLFEKSMINGHIYADGRGKAVVYDEDEGISIAVNDDDHITVNAYANGSEVTSVFEKADELASTLESKIDMAYSDKYGFLTSDVRRMGTGIQIMSVVAIPGIDKTAGAFDILAKRLATYDWQIAPMTIMSGEKVPGIFFLFNIATLGITEKALVGRARSVIDDVIKLERTCRKNICRRKKGIVDDQYHRSYAALRYARRIDVPEVLNLLNWIRLGYDEFKDEEKTLLNWELINKITTQTLRNKRTLQKTESVSVVFTTECANNIRSLLKGDE